MACGQSVGFTGGTFADDAYVTNISIRSRRGEIRFSDAGATFSVMRAAGSEADPRGTSSGGSMNATRQPTWGRPCLDHGRIGRPVVVSLRSSTFRKWKGAGLATTPQRSECPNSQRLHFDTVCPTCFRCQALCFDTCLKQNYTKGDLRPSGVWRDVGMSWLK